MKSRIDEIKNAGIKSRIKFLVKDSAIYGGALVLSRSLNILLLPLLTRLLTKNEYGVIESLFVLGNLMIPLIIMGFDSASARFYFETENSKERKQLMSEALFINILNSVIVTGLLYFGAGTVLSLYLKNTDFIIELKILSLILPFDIFIRFSQNLLKWTYQRTKFLIISTIPPILFVLLSILLILVYGAEIKYVFLARLISFVLSSLLSLIFIKDFLIFFRKFIYLKKFISFGFPIMITTVMFLAVPAVDRYFISSYLGLGFLGIYSVAFKISSTIKLAINGFETAWGPLSMSIYKEKNADNTYKTIFKVYVLFFVFLSFIFLLFIDQIVIVLASKKYLDAVILIIPLVFAEMIYGISLITNIGVLLSKKTYLQFFANAIYLITVVILIKFTIPYFGLLGVVFSTLFGRMVFFTITTIVAQRSYQINFEIFRPIVLMLLTILFGSVYILFIYNKGLISVVVLIAYIFAMLIYIWGFYLNSTERQLILKYLKKENII